VTPADPGAQLPQSEAGHEGFRAAVARVTGSLVALLATRAELASVEFSEERERLTQRLGLVAAGGLLLAFAALFVGAFVIVLFWDTHRLWAIAAVAFAHLVAGLILLSKARAVGRDAPSPFAATVAELKKDRELLERALAARER